MSDKLKNLFEESDCPDKAMLFSYIKGKLSPQKAHLVEEHLIDCAFCSEAIEAYRDESDLLLIEEKLIEIETRINRGELGRNRGGLFAPQRFLKYAALIVVMLLSMTGLYFLLSENKNEEMVMEAPVTRNAPGIQKHEKEHRLAPEPARAVKPYTNKNQDETAHSVLEESDDSANPLASDYSNGLVNDEEVTGTERIKELASSQKTSPATGNNKKPDISKDERSISTNESNSSHETETPANAEFLRLDNAFIKTETAQKSEELSRVAVVSTKQKSILDSAIQEYDQKYFIRTIEILKNFEGKDKRETAKAKWYLANAYVQTYDYVKAKPILEELIDSGSSYSRKARKLLENLN